MKLLTTVFLLSVIAGAQTKPSTPPTADTQPDYEQTRKWIVKKMGEAGYRHVVKGVLEKTEVGSYDGLSMDDCNLSFTEIERTIDSDSDKTTKEIVVVPLSKVSNIKVSHLVTEILGWNEWNLIIETSPNAVSYRVSEIQHGEEKLTNSHLGSDTEMRFGTSPESDEDSVKRTKKALDHAVSLCKGTNKNEPF